MNHTTLAIAEPQEHPPKAAFRLEPFTIWCSTLGCDAVADTIHLNVDSGDVEAIEAACPAHDPGGYWIPLDRESDDSLWADGRYGWDDWAWHLAGKSDAPGGWWQPLLRWLIERQHAMSPEESAGIEAVARIEEAAAERKRQQADRDSAGIERGDDWARRAPESVPRIIPGILPWQGIVTMSAHSETGKTWLLIAMLLSIANDRPFLGQYPIEKPGRCLYIGSEGSHAGARARFYAIARGMGLDPDEALANIDFLWRDGTLIDSPEFLAKWTALAPQYAVIGCDIVSDLWAGDENKNAEVIALLRGLRSITNAGPSVVLVHHWAKDSDSTSGRDEGQRSRGAVAWKTNTDAGIYLTRKKGAGRTTVTCTSSDDVPAASFTFNWPAQLVDGSEGIDLDWKSDESGLTTMQLVQRQAEALISSERGLSAHQIAERIHANGTTVTIALKGLEGLGAVEVQPVTYLDAAGRSRRRPGYFVTSDLSVSMPLEQERHGENEGHFEGP